MKNYSNKEELVEDLENIKKEQRIINTNEKDDIDEQAKEYNIHIKWDENKSNYFKNTYSIEDYGQEKIYKIMRTSDINNY